ncbi:Integrator complex subunit 2 [Taenia solium]|eukprot:TsM_000216500 transcript=TsM_000216500 gene=TsM_000216500
MMTALPLHGLFVASKTQSYDDLDEASLIAIFPHIYFTIENVDRFIVEKIKDASALLTVVELLQLLDSLAILDIKKAWEASLVDNMKKRTTQLPIRCRAHTYNDFEAQGSVELKVKLVIHQLQHVLNEDATEQCEYHRCCSLLESPALLNIVTAIISVVLIELSDTDILPDAIVGLSTHCALSSRLLIERLVLNFPQMWCDVYERLLGCISAAKDGLDQKQSARCLAMLHHLLTFVPDTNGLLNKCIQLRQLPGLVMQLAIKLSDDDGSFSLLNFFRRVLLDHGCKTQSWLGEYLKSTWETNPTFTADVNERILSAASGILDESKAVLPKEQLVPAIELLRTIAALCGYTGFVLSMKLRSFVLHLITHATGRSEKAINFICFCLAFVIGLRSCLFDSGGLNEASIAETEEQLVVWLRRLISRQDIFHTSLRQSSTYSEVLLLFGLLFNHNHSVAIRKIIVNTLGIDAPCFVRNISASRKLFIHKVFTCQSIATQAAHVPVTVRLNSNTTGNLPLHCVFELMRDHAFNKNRVQIKGWIYRQICESVRPLHPQMLEFLETYTNNALAQTVGLTGSQMIGACGGCVPFTEAELFSQFSDPALGPDARMCAPGATDFVTELVADSDEDGLQMDLTPQLLFLYYMFYIHHQELASHGTDNRGSQRGAQAMPSPSLFSDKLWDAIPITYLLQYARSNISSYRQLYPRLLLLVMKYRPHLTVGELTIQDELLFDPFWKSDSSFQPFNSFCAPRRSAVPTEALLPNGLLSVLDRILTPSTSLDSLKSARAECVLAVNTLVRTVNGLRGFSRLRHLLPYTEAIGCRLPRALLETAALSGNRRFASAVCFLWRSLHCLMPRRLEVLTVKALSSKSETLLRLTHRDLLKDPVENIVMGVDPRVYRCPPVLTLLIRIIDCNLRASRVFWWHRVVSRHFITPTNTIASEEQEIPTTASATPLPLVPITGETEMQGLARGRRTGGNARSTLEPVSGGGGGVGEGSAASSSQSNALESLASDDMCDRLRATLVTCQDATVVQLLLEFCLPNAKEKDSTAEVDTLHLHLPFTFQRLNSEVTNLREAQNIICTFIHFLFIGDPDLAKVVFWQTYPRSLNPLATRAIPSIQICTDSVLEIILKSGSLEDVVNIVFCLDFVAHLALHCAFNAPLNLATYAVEVMHLIFTHLTSLEEIASLLLACGPAFCQLGCAFPSISHRLAAILLSAMATLAESVTLTGGSRYRDLLVGRIAALKSVALSGLDNTFVNDASSGTLDLVEDGADSLPSLSHLTRTEKYLVACVHAMLWFNRLVRLTPPQRRLFFPPNIDELPSLLTWRSLPSVYSSCHSEK